MTSMQRMEWNASHQAAAAALWQARSERRPIAPLRDWIAAAALDDAYAVQSLNTARRIAGGARRIGRKIGLTSAAVQRQLGVDQPDFGVLFDDMLYLGPAASVPHGMLMQPRIEGEIAFVVAEDITAAALPPETLRRCAGDAMPAFEIVDSAVADWKITLADTVADNASCGALVVGTTRRSLAGFDARGATMALHEDGALVSSGSGAATLGDPLLAFAWLADMAVAFGDPLRAGEIVLTGALGPMVPFIHGRHYTLAVSGFDTIAVVAA